jgi:hypothetical protein
MLLFRFINILAKIGKKGGLHLFKLFWLNMDEELEWPLETFFIE